MIEKTVHLPNISCEHCVATIRRELMEIPGVKKVKGDHYTKDVTVQFDDPATWASIERTLDEIGYPVAD